MDFDLVEAKDMKGFKIVVGTEGVIPQQAVDVMNKIRIDLDSFRNSKIENESDYVKISDNLKTVKGYKNTVIGIGDGLIKPIKSLENSVKQDVKPLEEDCDYTESCLKKNIHEWKEKMEKKREEEKIENTKKAKEEEDKLKKEKEAEVIAAQKEVEVAEVKRKAEVEKKKELELKRIEEERKAIQASEQIIDAKKEIEKDPSKSDEIGKELGVFEKQKSIAEENIKNIDIDVSGLRDKIKLVSEEEIALKRRAQKLKNDKETIIVVPDIPLTPKVPKVSGLSFPRKRKFRLVDITLVPKEFTQVSIVLDEKKIKEAIKLDPYITIPGIEIYDEDGVRSTTR